ncbi:MFS transporter [Carnimonas nigrificans]|uniref:MFS transporter n=1 Tax=Carnimonas nigrificans TaxID=64323 RepID=UPI00046F97C3|nr:MFS transporter [Carnimonas nigrificans]
MSQHNITTMQVDPPTGANGTTGSQKRTNVRWYIFLIMLLLGTINYIDRVSLSVALPDIAREFEINEAQVIGIIQSGFFWAYALMQIPSGMLADRFRKRAIIAAATVGWGIAQASVALCTGTYSLFAARVALGITESPIMPAGAKLMGVWLHPNERARGAMLLDGGAPLGTALGAIVISALISFFGDWREAFVIAGILTVLTGGIAWAYIRNDPTEHPKVNEAELEYLAKSQETDAAKPTFKFKHAVGYLRQRNVFALILGWCSYSTVFYGLMTWLPFYLTKQRHLDITSMGVSMAVIFLLCFAGQISGGYIIDKLRKHGNSNNKVFHLFLAVSAITSGVGIFLAANVESSVAVIVLLGIAMFPLRWCCVYWSLPSLLGAQRVAGTILGTMNFASNMTSAIVPIIIGYLVAATDSYYAAMMIFVVAACLYLVSSLLINFNKPIEVFE